MMIFRSRAPLRLGLAGGGSDVSPFCDQYGGQVLNATINRYAYCTIVPNDEGRIVFRQFGDQIEDEVLEAAPHLETTGRHLLAKASYNRIIADLNKGESLGFELTTWSDAPPGSGLGSSSTVIVAILKAFCEWLKVPMSEYDIAALAFRVERVDLGQHGGHQDQYTAAFGGINFMEFFADDRVLVNPLRVSQWIVREFEMSMLLYYTSISRFSSEIIDEQIKSVEKNDVASIEATKRVKEEALTMKAALLQGRIREIADILDRGWYAKKNMAKSITNSSIDSLLEKAIAAGAYSGKVSGAGGGGFIMLMVDPLERPAVMASLAEQPGQFVDFQFELNGATSWRVSRGSDGSI
ncbi:dehydrogenase [Parasphingorhabdus sp.]|uniref:GHMP family kinase ATP-binding protein n=1 Tax=Parasphingorhabdus sp. TaxID=2709688 RepID=UPI0032EE6025